MNQSKVIIFGCLRVSPEGDSEVHGQVRCEVRVRGGLRLHPGGAFLHELSILPKDPGDGHCW